MPAALDIPDRELEAAVTQPKLRTDTLAESVVVLLVLAAVQRIVGFLRGMLVCRWLSPDELGQWDMAFGFLTLAAPLTVLGLPGSFGRYVEYFRQRGQLSALVKRTALACMMLTTLAVATISSLRPIFSLVVFGRPDETQLIGVLAATLAVVIAFNYLTELITALRMARKTAVVQFFNSLMFAGFSVLLLVVWKQGAASLVAAYGLACALQIGGMTWYLRRRWGAIPDESHVSDATNGENFWSRLLPFAAWVWVSNLLYNLFDVADRYMIVHTSTAADPLALVGSYHSSRIVPLLLVSVATLMGTMILPHLSHDWEAGRRRVVSDRMNLALKLLGLLLFVGSIVLLLAAPFLFNVAFNGKFRGGMEVFPWTLTYCSWFGLVTMAQLYLWCAERARLSCLALFTGLVINVALNSLLLPRFGLPGAVWATAAANFVALALIYRFNAWLGMRISRSLLMVSLLPITLGLGPVAAICTLVIVITAIVGTNQILSHDEKQRLIAAWRGFANRFPVSINQSSTAPALATGAADGVALPVWGPGIDDINESNLTSAAVAAELPSDRALRVMFVTTSMHVGGAEVLLFNLLRRIDRARFAPELCCLKTRGELGDQLASEIPVHAELLRNRFDLRVLPRLISLLRRRQIDAVVTVGAGDKMFWGRLAARMARVPVVVSALHSTGWPDSITWLNRRLTPLTDAFIAVASRHGQHLVDHEHLPASRVVIIPNGVDTEEFRPQSGHTKLRRELNLPGSAPLVGIVAVLRPEKNHELFLRMAARVRRDVLEAQFLVIGDGPRRAELELLASQLGLVECVHFLGRRADVPQLLDLLDVFVLTSHNEANPVSILEALATEVPVVATAVGSVPETVLNEVTGYLVEPGDELALARRVSELLLDPAKAQHLGSAGRRHVVENWSLVRMVSGYEELLDRLHCEKTSCSHSGVQV